MRGFFMAAAMLLFVLVLLLMYLIPPVVVLLATFVWRGPWIARAWVPVPVFVAAFWLLQTFGSSTVDLDAGEVYGVILIGGAAVLYYSRLFYLHRRERRQAAAPAL
jgi:hypothetical protein